MAKGGLGRLIKDLKRDDLIITPRLSLWLVRNDHVVVPPKVAAQLASIMSAEPRDRSGSFSASTRGQCHRRQVFQYLGVEGLPDVDIDLSNIFIDGTWRHLRMQATLLTAGIITDAEVGWAMPSLRLVGSIDGANLDEAWGWEHKGMNTYTFNSYRKADKPMGKHLLQVATYFIGWPELERWVLTYEDKNSHALHEFVLTRSDVPMNAARREILALNQAVDQQQLPEMIDECKKATAHDCPYRESCRAATWGSVARVDGPTVRDGGHRPGATGAGRVRRRRAGQADPAVR